MSNLKKILIGLFIVIAGYSGAWFLKANSAKSQIKSFLADNNSYITSSSVSVSGFPLFKVVTVKDVKLNLDNSFSQKFTTLSGRFQNIAIKEIKAKSGIFGDNFTVTTEAVTVVDHDNSAYPVEFAPTPKVGIEIANGKVVNFNYSDSGYKILNSEKVVVREATSSSIQYASVSEKDNKRKLTLKADFKGVSGFDIVTLYRNVYEKDLIKKIKDGEIVIGGGSSQSPAAPLASSLPPPPPGVPPLMPTPPVPPVNPAAPSPVVAVASATPAIPQNPTNPSVDPTKPIDPTKPVESATAELDKAKLNAAAVSDKVDISLDIERFVPESDGPALPIPTESNDTVAVNHPNDQTIKINNLEFITPSYRFNLYGQMDLLKDDSLPSGSFVVRIENFPSFLEQVTAKLTRTIETESMIPDQVTSGPGTAPADVNGVYRDFLKRVIVNLKPVTTELSAKSPLSNEKMANFEIKREKNLEFLINNTPLREVMGKF